MNTLTQPLSEVINAWVRANSPAASQELGERLRDTLHPADLQALMRGLAGISSAPNHGSPKLRVDLMTQENLNALVIAAGGVP